MSKDQNKRRSVKTNKPKLSQKEKKAKKLEKQGKNKPTGAGALQGR